MQTRRFGILVLAAFLFVFGALGCKGDPKPGQEAFNQANEKINVFEGDVGFGNTAAATALAKKIAVRIKQDEKENFEGGEDENTATTKGNFLTYCHETPKEIVLLVRVPNLDTYSGENRTELVKLAWTAAVELSADMRKAGDKKLTIALRGTLLYGGLATGMASADPKLETSQAIDTDKLYPSFANK
jgi:hypothetical protein